MLLAVVLSIFSVIAYSALTGRGCAPRPPEQDTVPAEGDPAEDGAADGAKGADDKGSKAGGSKAKGGVGPAPGVPAPDDPAPEDPGTDAAPHPQAAVAPSRTTLTSEELEVVVTSQGGALESVRLKRATEEDHESAFDLVLPIDPTLLMGSTDDTAVTPPASPGGAGRTELPAGPLRSPDLPWTRDEAAEQATAENDAIYTFETPEGLVHTKRWILSRGAERYDLSLALSVHAKAGATSTATSVDLALITSAGQVREYIRSAFANPSIAVWRDTADADLHEETEQAHGIGLQELPSEGVNRRRLAVFGVRSAYFLTVLYRVPGPNEPEVLHYWATGEDASQRGRYEENLARFYKDERGIDITTQVRVNDRIRQGVPDLLNCWVVARLPVQRGTPASAQVFHFFLGPNERSVLSSDTYKPLGSLVTYPNAPDFVADILMWIYDFWLGLLGSAGLAVILMTLVVRGGLMPLSVRNQLSMRNYGRKVAKLKPKVAELQKKFANNPKKLRDEQMKLYREHGVGFPSGCLMMLIQIPIFFSLFSALRVEYTLRGTPFMWIQDLAGPDRLIDFGSRVIDLGFFWVEGINLLPILMVGLSILHTRNMPKPADEQQAQQMKMMKWLPIIFAFILYNYTAALAIYMVLSSAVAIVESKIVRSKDEAATAPAVTP